MKKNVTMVIVLVVLISGILFAGGKQESTESAGTETSKQEEKPLVAFSQGTIENIWRALNTEDMEKWAKKSGYDYVWTDAQKDAMKQLNDCKDLIAKGPDVLVVAPVQAEPLAPVAKLCEEAGVTLVTIDREIAAPVGEGTYVAKIVQSWTELGRIQARYTVELLTEEYGEPKGNIVEIFGTIGASPSDDMQAGLREVLADYPNIKIIDSQSGDYIKQRTYEVMQDYLQKYGPGEIDAVIVHGDEMGIGAIQAIKEADREDEFFGKIAVKNGQRIGLEYVLNGWFYVNPQATPYYGEATMELVKKILAGEEIENPVIDVPFLVFDNDENKEQTQEYYDYLVENDLVF